MNYLFTITTMNEGSGDFNWPPLDTFFGTADEANVYAEENFSEYEWYVLDEAEAIAKKEYYIRDAWLVDNGYKR